jgi:hypothetical protein
MNCLPRYLDGQTGLLDVARRFGLPLDEVHEYAMQWVDKGLADVVDWVASEQDRRRPMP